MLRKFKKPKFLERIFQFLHDILGILYSFRYSSTSKPVSYHYLVSILMQIQIAIQIVIQTYNSFGMQRFYHRKEKRNFTSGGAMPFLSYFEISFAIQVLYFSKTYTLQLCWRLDLVAEFY